MKQFHITFTFIILSWNCFSQKICSLTPEADNTFLCLEEYASPHSSIKMTNTINQILKKAGLSGSNFIIKNCNNIENAVATNYKAQRFILMDEKYFSKLSSQNEVGYIMILGHEIGHHLHGHLVLKTSTYTEERKQELQADRFSGYIIGKLGYSFNNIENFAKKIFPVTSSNTHPGLTERLNAYRLGFNDAISEKESIKNEYYDEISQKVLNDITTNNLLRARDEYAKLVENYSETQLNKAIEAYIRISYISDDLPFIDGEMAELYALKNDNVNAQVMSLKAYDDIKSEAVPISSFLILAWEYSRRGNFNLDTAHLIDLNSVDYKKITSPIILKYFATYLASQDNYNKALEVLNFATSKFNMNEMSNDDRYTLSDLLNDRAIVNLRLEQLELGYADINSAVNLRTKADLIHSTDVSSINFLVDKKNKEVLFSNLALLEMKTNRFVDCIKTSRLFLNDYPESEYLKNGDVYYYLGRSLFETKSYKESIEYLTLSIKVSPLNHFLYYYRGLAHYSMNNKLKACMDFTISCDGGFNPSCNRLNLICNEE